MITLKCNLPDGWKLAPLTELCEVNPTKPKSFKRNADAPTTFIPMEALDEKTGAVFSSQVRPYGTVARGYTYFEEGDIIFAKITPCMQNGKTAIMTGLLDKLGFGSTEFHVLRAKPGIDSRWIYYLLRSAEFRRVSEDNFEGSAGQRRVPDHFLKEVYVPFYEKGEALRVLMDQLDNQMRKLYKIRAATKRQSETIDSFELSLIRERFETPAADWMRTSLGDLSEIIMGQSPDGLTYNKTGGGLPLLNGPTEFGADHPTPAQWTTNPKKVCQTDDLLICVRGNTTGRMNRADQEYALGRGVAAVRGRTGKGHTRFIRHAINYQLGKLLIGSERSTFPNIGKEDIAAFEIFAPADPGEQERLAVELDAKLSNVRSLHVSAERQTEAINTLPAATLREFFNFGGNAAV